MSRQFTSRPGPNKLATYVAFFGLAHEFIRFHAQTIGNGGQPVPCGLEVADELGKDFTGQRFMSD